MTHFSSRARASRSPAATQKKSGGPSRDSAQTAQLEALARLVNRGAAQRAKRDDGALVFPPELWDCEPSETMQNNLGAKFHKGRRLRKGLDYRSVDGNAYAVAEHEDKAIVLREQPCPDACPLVDEVAKQAHLFNAHMPAAHVLEAGYYAENGVAFPAVVLTRYLTTSPMPAREADDDLTPSKTNEPPKKGRAES